MSADADSQARAGVTTVDLTQQIVPLAVLKLVPVEIAREHAVLPLSVHEGRLHVATSKPDDRDALDEVAFLASREIVAHAAPRELVLHVLEQAYALERAGKSHFVGSGVTPERLVQLGLTGLETSEPLPVAAPPEPPPPPPPPADAQPAAAAVPEAPSVAAAPAARPSPRTAAVAAPGRTSARAPAAAPGKTAAGRSPEPARTSARPAAPMPGAAEASGSAEPAPAALPQLRGTVVVAVADEEARQSLVRLLEATGLTVHAGSDGAGGLQLARKVKPQVIVIEAVHPTLRGLELLRRLFSDAALSAIPVIVLSDGHWRLGDDLKERYGVKHFFSHPYHRDPLLAAIRRELEPEAPAPASALLSDEAAGHWGAAMAAVEKDDLDHAVRELDAAVKVDADAFVLRFHLGLVHGRRGDLFAAIGALERAVELEPRDFAALKNLAVVCQKAGLRRMARDAWERASSVAPDAQTARAIRALILESLA